MPEPVEESYFNWLCAKVISRNSHIYVDLLKILHETEFVWLVLGDRNRAEDGLELREDFTRASNLDGDYDWAVTGCSVLEMLIAFAKRAAFQTDEPVKDWFWELLTNLRLNEYRQVHPNDRYLIEDILYTFVWRMYDHYGDGGLFPLRRPTEHQREVEVWYQFCAYLEDQGRI